MLRTGQAETHYLRPLTFRNGTPFPRIPKKKERPMAAGGNFMSQPSSLDRIPQAAFDLERGAVAALNAPARRLLPGLEPGDPAPLHLPAGDGPQSQSGFFTWGQNSFSFTLVCQDGSGRVLLAPAAQTALTSAQLEGFTRQLRQVQNDMLLEVQQLTPVLERRADSGTLYHLAAFRQSFYQLCRLSRNLEYLSRAQQGEIVPRFTPLDLARLCSQLSGEAGALLSEGGVALTYRGGAGSLLVPGDPELLPLVVLGLLSNAAKNTPRGELVLRLLQRPGQAILLLRQGGALTQRQLDELLTLTSSGPIPLPGQGAGMGLTVIQHIISLHRGALLWRPEENGLLAAMCLPTGPMPAPNVPVRTPILQTGGGLSPVLMELSDVLPVSAFESANLE